MLRAKPLFLAALAGVVLLRLVLAALLPMTGDEAYFFFWGHRPALGYYDHPPMVGWWLAAMDAIGGFSAFWARLPSVLLIVPVSLAVVALARPAGEAKAWLAGVCTLAVTPEWLNVLISTDTPLVFFSVLSLVAYVRAVRAPGAVNVWHVLAGLALGAALDSKFFAALLALGYVAFVVVSPRAERRWPGLLVVAVCALPPVLVNVWWNAENCWANVMFNLYNRHGDARASWRTPLLYLVTLAYATSPLVLWQLARNVRAARALAAEPGMRLVLASLVLPLGIFAVLSIPKTIGLHWLFSFTPLVFVVAAHVLSERQLKTNLAVLAAIAAVHLVALAVIAIAPIETWSRMRIHDGVVLTVRTDAVLDAARRVHPGAVLASDSYSNAVTLGFGARAPVAVFGEGSGHARHDDIVTDFRALDGKDIVVIRKSPPPPGDYAPYFASVAYHEAVIHGATFHFVEGRGFRYAPYRDTVLATIRDKYYRIPAFLPQLGCYFCTRYFASACPVRR